jgi:phosphonopyruvate decarboxylase
VIDADALLKELTVRGVAEVTGVPCSYLTPLINRVVSDSAVRYLSATHEGEGLAMASGSWLAGVTTCVVAQNSGLGNMVNTLTSLNTTSRIPVPLIVTWRGEPGKMDEPQHELMGAITPSLLSLIGVSHAILPSHQAEISAVLDTGWYAMDQTDLPYAFVVRDGTITPELLAEPDPPVGAAPKIVTRGMWETKRSRLDALECLLETLPPSAAVISTTGKTSRELFTLADRPQHFYLVGAMGSAAAVGLGVARHTDRPVVVIDGDGAALMRLGTLATIGAQSDLRLVHVLLDNQIHDSTGGQRSQAAHVDFPAIAAACGYKQVHACRDLAGFAGGLRSALSEPGPAFVYLRIRPGSRPDLGRPDVHPREVARRFRAFVTGSSSHKTGTSRSRAR